MSLFTTVTGAEKRKRFKESLKSGKLHQMPGAFSPYISLMIEQSGFDGVYISGAGIANDLAIPDIGMTTETEVVTRGRQIAESCNLPTLIDIDTGFGEPMSVARTIRHLEDAGVSACHLEDQINPKRCGHLDGKEVVSKEEMIKKIKAAVASRRDSNFQIMARTDAKAIEGLDKAIDRAKAYVDAGADLIFPEAMYDEKDFEAFRKAINVPLLANMTEFGKSKLLTTSQLSGLGYNIVIYPMTCFRLAMGAIEKGLQEIKAKGTQEGLVDDMQTRKRLYEILNYERYNDFDQSLFNFKL